MAQSIVEFISRYDPSYPDKVRGAHPHEMERLKALSGQELPPSYKAFLSEMGKSMGDLSVPQTDFSIDRCLEFHSEGGQLPPRHYLFIASHDQDPYIDYYLDLSTSTGLDCDVVRITSEAEEFKSEYVHPLFLPFNDLMLTFAFTLKRMSYLPHRAHFTPSRTKARKQGADASEPLRIIEVLALRMGFRKIPDTSSRCLLLDRQDAAIYGRSTPNGGIHAELAASTERERSRLREIICDHTSLV